MKKILAGVAAVVMLIMGVLAAGCSEEIPEGSFYTLQEAYESGWLTVEDLETIADYHNNGMSYPESLSEEVAESIKYAWIKQLSENDTDSAKDITVDKVAIKKYYGSYHDCVVVIVDRLDANYPAINAPVSVEVGNVTFHYNNAGPQISVCKI